jgi:hypothetical protein
VSDLVASADARAALLRKYRLLCRWRRGKDQSFEPGAEISEVSAAPEDGLASRAAMRALAEEFPGALRELDLLGLPELERRVVVLARAEASDEPEEPWIAWILSYHDVMRGELAKRLAAARGAGGNVSATSEVIGALQGDLARPPGGKLSLAVLREVARRFGVPSARIAATLFPSRRTHVPSAAP